MLYFVLPMLFNPNYSRLYQTDFLGWRRESKFSNMDY